MPSDGLEYSGGRRFLRIIMSPEAISLGWPAFMRIWKECRNWGVNSDELEYRYTEENYGHVATVWEVVPEPSPDAHGGWMYRMEGASDV